MTTHPNYPPNSTVPQAQCDWGEAPDVSGIYERGDELAALAHLIMVDRCRLVVLLGLGGVGKTMLATKLAHIVAEKVDTDFDYVIWRSLRSGPPVSDLLADCIMVLAQQERKLAQDLDTDIQILLRELQRQRCLLVFDNLETILLADEHTDEYRDEFRDYGRLFERLAGESHRSCVVLTSRNLPVNQSASDDEPKAVQLYPVTGLKLNEVLQVLADKDISGAEEDWDELCRVFSGNPLALRLIAETIREGFGGNIRAFLDQGTRIFGDVRDLISQHINDRLSLAEQSIIYWLAVYREAINPHQLSTQLFEPLPELMFQEAVAALHRRSLVDYTPKGITLPAIVLEYATELLVEKICEEIESQSALLLKSHALMLPPVRENVRRLQVDLILRPILQRLLRVLRSKNALNSSLLAMLAVLQTQPISEQGYAGGNIINLLAVLHNQKLRQLNLSHISARHADLRDVKLDTVNFAYADLHDAVFAHTFGSIMTVAFSPDGQAVAASGVNGEICLWSAADGKELQTLKCHSDRERSIVFHPAGQFLISGGADRTVRVWDYLEGRVVREMIGHTDAILCVALSSDATIIASASADSTIRLWNFDTGTHFATLQGHTGWVWSVVFNPDGALLASGSADGTVRLWDVSSQKNIAVHTLPGANNWIWSIAFHPTLPLLATGSADKTVRLWRVDTGVCEREIAVHDDRVRSVSFSPNGQLLATCSDDTSVKLWDANTGAWQASLHEHTAWVRSVAFSRDGRSLASGGDDQTICIWELPAGPLLLKVRGYTNRIWSIAFSPVNHLLASGGDNAVIKLWDTTSQDETPIQQLVGHTSRVRSVTFSQDSFILASGGDDRTVRLWRVDAGYCFHILHGHTDWIRSVALSPNAQLVASGGDDRMIKLWDTHSGTCLNTFSGHTDWVRSITFSHDGRYLVSASNDQTVRLWDVHTGTCLRVLHGHTHRVRSVAISPDGRLIVSGSNDHTIRVWDAYSGECLHTIVGHAGWVRAVVFSHDGRLIASGSDDQTIRLWDVGTGQRMCDLRRPEAQHQFSPVFAVAFSADDSLIGAAGDGEEVALWNNGVHNTGVNIYPRLLKSPRTYENTDITGATGLSKSQTVALKLLGAYTRAADDRADVSSGISEDE